jgi:hypothetical protein
MESGMSTSAERGEPPEGFEEEDRLASIGMEKLREAGWYRQLVAYFRPPPGMKFVTRNTTSQYIEHIEGALRAGRGVPRPRDRPVWLEGGEGSV